VDGLVQYVALLIVIVTSVEFAVRVNTAGILRSVLVDDCAVGFGDVRILSFATVFVVPAEIELSTYSFVAAWRFEIGFCPRVKIAPEDNAICAPDDKSICAPADNEMMLLDDRAKSAPLTIDRFCDRLCACDLSNRFSGEIMDASVVLFRADPLLISMLSVADTA